MEALTGGCLCGAVRIAISGEPYRVGICHCLDCRKHHGAVFGASAMYPIDAVAITGTTADYNGRHFCPTCGSSLFARSLFARSLFARSLFARSLFARSLFARSLFARSL